MPVTTVLADGFLRQPRVKATTGLDDRLLSSASGTLRASLSLRALRSRPSGAPGRVNVRGGFVVPSAPPATVHAWPGALLSSHPAASAWPPGNQHQPPGGHDRTSRCIEYRRVVVRRRSRSALYRGGHGRPPYMRSVGPGEKLIAVYVRAAAWEPCTPAYAAARLRDASRHEPSEGETAGMPFSPPNRSLLGPGGGWGRRRWWRETVWPQASKGGRNEVTTDRSRPGRGASDRRERGPGQGPQGLLG
jgi:hypothetical protein